MIQKEIYERDIERKVNPAVSAMDVDPKTIETEIDEYVFTDEILNGLCEILIHVKDRDYSHDGIWINGYYGSGKSHFLKFLCYCLNAKEKEYQEKALVRLEEAAKERDSAPSSKFNYTWGDVKEVIAWLRNKAEVDIIMFNIGSVHNVRGEYSTTFVESFWNQFNQFRGYNSFNISLAQHFEKVLDEAGKFQEFIERVKANRANWHTQASSLAVSRLDNILQIGKELVPDLSVDVVRDYIKNNKTVISVQTFCQELKEYVGKQGRDYRLLFLADEVSQFINDNKGLLLQLQEIVTHLHETCDDKVWVGCTAQLDLSEILSACNISATTEDYGKIMGRFEVKVSLEGTQPEYITQKRILEKNGKGMAELNKLYGQKRTAIDTQFQLPTGYDAFTSQDKFVAFYPFVPYQFRLIKQVFFGFQTRGLVEKEVKDNERSVIKVTHATAKIHMNDSIGKFIPFDAFYNTSFTGKLMATGQRAISNANAIIQSYPRDPQFGQRVVNVLFMICNLMEDDKLVFPATVDNITTLLMKDVDAQKVTLKNDVQKVLDYLKQKKVIRLLTEEESHSTAEVWAFYTEDESEVAKQIEGIPVDNNTLAEQLRDIFTGYTSPANRETFHTARLSVGGTVLGKNFLSNNADVQIEFIIQADGKSPAQFALNNADNRLCFFMAEQYQENKNLRDDLFEYCKVQKFLRDNNATTEERKKTMEEFRRRAADLFRKKIEQQFKQMFDECIIISGQSVINNVVTKGENRYKDAMRSHLERIYTYAHCADEAPQSSDGLRSKILRNIEPGEYDLKPMSEAETLVEQYLKRQFREVPLSDVISYFQKAPYGWSEPATIHFCNELVRRHNREFAYNGQAVDRKLIANNILSDRSSFSIREASAIPQQEVNDFLAAWKYIFNDTTVLSGLDTIELAKQCQTKLDALYNRMTTVYGNIAQYPFVETLKELMPMVDEWKEIRDNAAFFKKVVNDKESAKVLMDKWKQILQFHDDQLARYREYVEFVNKSQYDFPELPEDTQHSVELLKAMVEEKWPIDKMPTYKKLVQEVRFKIAERVKELKAEIGKNYDEIFTALEKVAEEAKPVGYVLNKNAKEEAMLPNSITVLITKLDVQSFYEAEVKRIMSLVPGKPTPPGDGEHEPPKPMAKLVPVVTRSTKMLKTAEDVEEYLETIRKQLMKYIDNGDSIMVK
ncbi:BREX system P-loop protein BrxC [uncultured Prevotella sp.]|uniref:BREX system P-loop protein BrxC n=1 Tax=uncultured Prevotella sp. TaxID=159272 RepID=UPI00258640EE|nr:BREX system P-loop protein BrxC [uncultured Prevotella sp.]